MLSRQECQLPPFLKLIPCLTPEREAREPVAERARPSVSGMGQPPSPTCLDQGTLVLWGC